MGLWDIALKNLLRRKSKALLLILSLAFGVGTIVTLVTITEAMQRDMAVQLEGIGSKIIIKPKMDKLAFAYGPITIASGVAYDVKELKEDSLNKIKELGAEKINIISPKLLVPIQVYKTPAIMVGLDFDQETKLKTYWDIEGSIPVRPEEILLGFKAAHTFDVHTGETLYINDREFIVTGTLAETGSEEDGLVFAQLPAVQEIHGKKGALTFVEVNITGGDEATNKVEGIAQEISALVPDAEVIPVKDAVDSRRELVDRFKGFSLIISLIVTLIGALIVMAAMISSVNERTREIGIFRAIGYRKSHVTKIILIEAGSLSLLGALLGYLVGYGTSLKVTPLITGLDLAINWNPLMMVLVLLGATLVGLMASIYPASKAAKLDPAEALRFI